MKLYLVIFMLLFVVAQSSPQCRNDKMEKKEPTTMVKAADEFKELPDGAKLDDEVREIIKDEQGHVVSTKIIPVETKLKEIGAGYVDGILVDSDGKQIRFFKPMIRGISEGLEADKKFRQSEEKRLADLKEEFTVIEIYVNPLKIM